MKTATSSKGMIRWYVSFHLVYHFRKNVDFTLTFIIEMYLGQLESIEQVRYPKKFILKNELKKTLFRDSNTSSRGLFC